MSDENTNPAEPLDEQDAKEIETEGNEELLKLYEPLSKISPEFGQFIVDTVDAFASSAFSMNNLQEAMKLKCQELEKRINGAFKAIAMINESIAEICDILEGKKNVESKKPDTLN